MKKNFAGLLILSLSTLILTACSSKNSTPNSGDTGQKNTYQPLYAVADASVADKIVVISDLHLGIDDKYAETVENKALLVNFIHSVSATKDIAEVVIAGDLFDEWFLSFSVKSHTDSSEFYEKIAKNNSEVIDAFKELISTYGKKVTYVPGNHDMTLDQATLEKIIPGIKQARDVNGLGSYRTGSQNEIVIEHGHRYNVFVAPDTISNKNIAGNKTFLPPGYFFTRIAASSVLEGKPQSNKEFPVVNEPTENNTSKIGAYLYYKTWLWVMNAFPVNEGFNDKVIDVKFNGYNNQYSLSDIFPTEDSEGNINAVLFPNFQNNWEEVQDLNGVKTHIPFNEAIQQATTSSFIDDQATKQYFNNDPTTKVVVFGHTHVPFLEKYSDSKLYANSGTWIDKNTLGETATFVLIEKKDDQHNVQTFKYNDDGSIKALFN